MIEKELAIQLCDAIRAENEKKKLSIWKVMCYFCLKAAKGDPSKRCVCANSENRGCTQVNKRFEKLEKK
ncbi:MAG: hypothetical protein EU536_04610 [Promethearchaeota archaeon]|nr:MAG: hypothetical protein EU536_04610 [Candidatus Lokiarchaeota archaeon]